MASAHLKLMVIKYHLPLFHIERAPYMQSCMYQGYKRVKVEETSDNPLPSFLWILNVGIS